MDEPGDASAGDHHDVLLDVLVDLGGKARGPGSGSRGTPWEQEPGYYRIDMLRLLAMPAGMARRGALLLDLDLDRWCGRLVGLELLLMPQLQLSDLLWRALRSVFSSSAMCCWMLLHDIQLLAEPRRLLVVLHDPSGGHLVQVGTVVAIRTFKAARRIRATAHDATPIAG